VFVCRRMKFCYYKILGISDRANQDEIKRAFRLLALRWHPDRNPEDPRACERFKEALEAYETLIIPARRSQYDRSRGYQKPRKKPGYRSYEAEGNGRGASFEDALHEAFGIQPGRRVVRGNSDLRFDLMVSPAVLTGGIQEEISFTRMVFCETCVGNGRKSKVGLCNACGGTGQREENCSIYIQVPPGSRDGTRLRIVGAGDRIYPGIAPGDLVILLHIGNAL
jgi:molecular chaperone DnaJ